MNIISKKRLVKHLCYRMRELDLEVSKMQATTIQISEDRIHDERIRAKKLVISELDGVLELYLETH